MIALTNLRLCLPELPEARTSCHRKKAFPGLCAQRAGTRHPVVGARSPPRRLIKSTRACRWTDWQSGRPSCCVRISSASMWPAWRVMLESALCSMYTRQQNKVFDEALRKGRTRFRPVRLFSRGEGVKPIIRAMREGLPFFMLPDMDFGEKDAEFVPFFGMPAATLTAPARIAAATGAQRDSGGRHLLPNYRGWKVHFSSGLGQLSGRRHGAATRRMNAFIEERVLEAPAEYFWAHKRFKTRPPGVPSVYHPTTINGLTRSAATSLNAVHPSAPRRSGAVYNSAHETQIHKNAWRRQ